MLAKNCLINREKTCFDILSNKRSELKFIWCDFSCYNSSTVINLSYFEYIGIYNKSLPLVDIKSMQKLSSTKYALGRKN